PAPDHELRPRREVAVASAHQRAIARGPVAPLAVDAEAHQGADLAPDAQAPLDVDLAVVAGAEARDRVRVEVPPARHVRREEPPFDLALHLVVGADAEPFDLELPEH